MSAPRDASDDRAPGRAVHPARRARASAAPAALRGDRADQARVSASSRSSRENYLGASPRPGSGLRRIAERTPIVAHGVSVNLSARPPRSRLPVPAQGSDPGASAFLYFTDHPLLDGVRGRHVTHDLLPAPCDPELILYAAGRAFEVQEALGVPFGIENLSSYVALGARRRCLEWEFYRRVVEESGCWAMLDINNVFVSSENHGFDPRVPRQRALAPGRAGPPGWPPDIALRLAARRTIARCATGMVSLRRRVAPGRSFPTLLEWDAEIPPLHVALAELGKARRVRSSWSPRGGAPPGWLRELSATSPPSPRAARLGRGPVPRAAGAVSRRARGAGEGRPRGPRAGGAARRLSPPVLDAPVHRPANELPARVAGDRLLALQSPGRAAPRRVPAPSLRHRREHARVRRAAPRRAARP